MNQPTTDKSKASRNALWTDLRTFVKAHPIFTVLLALVMLTQLEDIVTNVLSIVVPLVVLGAPVAVIIWGVRTLRNRSRAASLAQPQPVEDDAPTLYQHRHIQ